MKDIEILTTLANDRTPFTDLDWRKKLLKQVESPAVKPLIRQALAYMKEMEVGIRSNSPLFTPAHAKEARSNIRTVLSKALSAVNKVSVTDEQLQAISDNAKKIDGTQKQGIKLYKNVPITVTNLFGTDLDKLNRLLSNVDIQGYPVFLTQMVLGVNPKVAKKELKGVEEVTDFADHIQAYFLRMDKTGTLFEGRARDENLVKYAYQYKSMLGAKWDLVSGQVHWKNGIGYLWIASTYSLARHIGAIVEGKDREWSVASFKYTAPVTNKPKQFDDAFLDRLFDVAHQLKKARMRINYTDLVKYFLLAPYNRQDLTEDLIRGLLKGEIQTEDTAGRAAQLGKFVL